MSAKSLEQIVEDIKVATHWLSESVAIDRGEPVIIGSRVPVSRVLAELGDGYNIHEIASELGVDKERLVKAIKGLTIFFNRSLKR